jgi:hypothetical protein
VEAERLELARLGLRIAPHAGGEVLARLLDDEPRRLGVAGQADRVAGDTKPDLDLGAHGHPLDERAERVGEKRVLLVAAVVAHLLAQEAGGDAEPDLFVLALAHAVD